MDRVEFTEEERKASEERAECYERKAESYREKAAEVRKRLSEGRFQGDYSGMATPPTPDCYHCYFARMSSCALRRPYGKVCLAYLYRRADMTHKGCSGQFAPDTGKLRRIGPPGGDAVFAPVMVCNKCGIELLPGGLEEDPR